jgi:hypothetical protein
MERKLNMVIEIVPLEIKQSLQIGIPEEFAISFVAFLVPTSGLAVLIALTSASSPHLYTVTLIWPYFVAVPEKQALGAPL